MAVWQDWQELTNIFLQAIYQKNVGSGPKNISHSIVKRIKFSFSNEERYFPNDSIQFLPDKGYTELFYKSFRS